MFYFPLGCRDSDKTPGGLRDAVVPAAVVAGTSNAAEVAAGSSKSKQAGREITHETGSSTTTSTSSPVVLSDGSNGKLMT